MKFNPAQAVQDIQYFGEFGGVNPSIEDSSTYTFLQANKMEEIFEKEIEGCYLYSRHWNPTNRYLSQALAKMENTESAVVTASGIAAITSAILQICQSGDEIVSSRMIYGGTYAFMKNFAPKLGIKTTFVDTNKPEMVERAITSKTKIVYCESMSNPMLEVTDLKAISDICKKRGVLLVVDNTFTPMMISPVEHGADIVIHSLTKFINGTSDTVAGVICGNKTFIDSLSDVNHGAVMLLGPVMDSLRSSSVLKNMRSLALRMMQHSRNALYLAEKLQASGLKVVYPGLANHPQHEVMKRMMNPVFGFGGMLVLDVKNKEKAYELMELMQNANIGYLAVSLGFYKTLFSAPGSSTSSEIPENERLAMGLSDGLVRMSIGLDSNPEITYERMMECVKKANV